jgi:polysaccharide export outer membrane protein
VASADTAAEGAVDIVIGEQPSTPVVEADAAPQEVERASPVPSPSLFDQLVAPSWGGGGGYDRAPWPEENTPNDATVRSVPDPAEQQVTPIAQPPSGEVLVEPSYEQPAAAAPQAERQPTPAAGGDDYLLGPGDRVDVFVWRNPDLSRQVPVRPDGRITLPLAGEVFAAGKTVAALRDEITGRLADYIQMPTVTVTIAEIRSLVVYVLGDVRSPGAVQMDRNLTVLQAIAAVGGLNEFADRNDIVVMRTLADGTAERWTFRYDDVVEGKRLETNIVLQAGDTIIVP